jgi:acyl carrier protein
MNEKDLLMIINTILSNANKKQIDKLNANAKLKDDLGLDSLNLAELTVRIEHITGVDIFEKGLILTVGEILKQFNNYE